MSRNKRPRQIEMFSYHVRMLRSAPHSPIPYNSRCSAQWGRRVPRYGTRCNFDPLHLSFLKMSQLWFSGINHIGLRVLFPSWCSAYVQGCPGSNCALSASSAQLLPASAVLGSILIYQQGRVACILKGNLTKTQGKGGDYAAQFQCSKWITYNDSIEKSICRYSITSPYSLQPSTSFMQCDPHDCGNLAHKYYISIIFLICRQRRDGRD